MPTPTKTARFGSRPRTPSISESHHERQLHHEQKHHGQQSPAKAGPPVTPTRAIDTNDTSPEDGDDEDEDEDEDSDDDADVLRPPGGRARRGHQTGLSLSLGNTSLGKRGRSPDSSDVEERPMSKMSKTDGDGETSDDDAYNAVDDIGSDEEDNSDIEKVEERVIIHSEGEESRSQPGARGSFSSAGSIFGGLDHDLDLFLQPEPTFFDDRFDEVLGQREQEDDEAANPTRRVRFAEEVLKHYATGSSSSSTESEDEMPLYPDIFIQQNSLDPSFRKLVEKNTAESGSDGEGSYWDFENDDRIQELGDDDESSSESSGYETDEGETTDEDFNVPLTVKPNKGLLRFDDQGRARPKNTVTPNATPLKKGNGIARRGPTMGSFLVDDDKPIAVIDSNGKNMLIFPAPKHSRAKEDSPAQAGSPAPPNTASSSQAAVDIGNSVGFTTVDPMLSSPANTMMSTFGTGRARAGSGLSTELLGPEEAFFPSGLNTDGSLDGDDLRDLFDNDMFSEGELFEDFINFGNGSSDEETNRASHEQIDDSTAAEETDVDKTPQPASKFAAIKSRAPTTPTQSNPGSLLDHFDRGVASSFRRNADRHKNWTRSPMAAGIKGGRFEVANNPISPMRRRRGVPATPSSQLQSMGPPATPASASKLAKQPIGGPMKKRIKSSETVQKRIQRYELARQRKNRY